MEIKIAYTALALSVFALVYITVRLIKDYKNY